MAPSILQEQAVLESAGGGEGGGGPGEKNA
jgi:hypothetical protein